MVTADMLATNVCFLQLKVQGMLPVGPVDFLPERLRMFKNYLQERYQAGLSVGGSILWRRFRKWQQSSSSSISSSSSSA
jgi:hypothetical protein